ncbi:MAG: hypothetical protein O2839_08875 [Cyanobacteria bacterium]|nr:hypothetical protein [Cyanobacteriota bacterium]MDA1246687.1 hypothetical protein [Cyanobacteriota bacterium]
MHRPVAELSNRLRPEVHSGHRGTCTIESGPAFRSAYSQVVDFGKALASDFR